MIIKQKPQKSPLRKGMICLIGIDGSGKTTHCRALVRSLKKSNIKSTYVWFGVAYFFAFPFMIACRILGLTSMRRTENGLYTSEHEYYKNRAMSKIWPWIQFIDTFIFVSLIVKPLIWRGFTIVCDRFVPDIMVDLMTDTKSPELLNSQIGHLMLGLMPKSMLLVCMDVHEKIVRKRKGDVLGVEYLRQKRNEYRRVSRYLDIPLISAEEPFIFVQKNLISLLHAGNSLW